MFIWSAMWPGFSRSTLFSAITTGLPKLEHAPRDVPVARADPLARVEDEHRDVEVVGHRLLDPALHPLGERVDRLLPAGKVDEDELGVLLRPTPRIRWRVVCGTCDTIAIFSPVSAFAGGRLADVGPAGERRRSRTSFGQVQVSGAGRRSWRWRWCRPRGDS